MSAAAVSQGAEGSNPTDDADGMEAEEVKLWSFQEPPLAVGRYSLTVSHTIKTGSDKAVETTLQAAKALVVSSPRFRLPDENELHSVYPAPGHSDYCQTLAHVVFNHPTTPWCRGKTEKVGFNRMPWMGLVSFTEDELFLDSASWKHVGFDDKAVKTVSTRGTLSVLASVLKNNTMVASQLAEEPNKGDDNIETVEVLLLASDVFGYIFTTQFSPEGVATRTGPVDVSQFAMMAHVREAQSSATSNTKPSNPQSRFSVVVSPRTGPPNVSKPTRMVSHLVSLEGVKNIDVAGNSGKPVGLVSLYSWDWMCIPPEHVDFSDVMRALGHGVAPLRIQGPKPDPKYPEAAKRLDNTLKAGYTLKPHTLPTGEPTTSLFRGPLIPVLPARKMIEPFAAGSWEDLSLVNTATGLGDASYSAAWNLGRLLAMADGIFTASLLRLRGSVHVAAVDKAKAKALGKNTLKREAALADVVNSLKLLARDHDVQKIDLAKRGAHQRWVRTENDHQRTPVERLAKAEYTIDDYKEAAKDAMNDFFGYHTSGSSAGANADAVAVQTWAVGKYQLATIPMHYLVPDPDMLPRESIRTFCVDANWVEAVIDGGLALANHHTTTDDALRGCIVDCFKRHIKDTQLRVPKWGFLMRSIAVAAFPDLRVQALWPKDSGESNSQRSEVLSTQILADDVLLCLLDRVPGQDSFTSIIISQPPHQQCFALGETLTAKELTMVIRPIPARTGETLRKAKPITLQPPTKAEGGKVDVYDWESRLIRLDGYTKHYLDTVGSLPAGKVFKMEGGFPSSLLATQLSKPVLCLKLPVQPPPKQPPQDQPKNDDHGQNRAPPQRPPPKTRRRGRAKDDGAVSRRDPAFTEMPRGPRKHVPPVELGGKGGLAVGDLLPFLGTLPLDGTLPLGFNTPSKPLDTSCRPLFDPGASGSNVYALDTPFDLVFTLAFAKDDQAQQGKHPDRLEVRIPVAFGTTAAPATSGGGSDAAVLLLAGSAAAPVLPTVESLNSNSQWVYTTHLAVGGLYEAKEGELPKRHDERASLLLVVTLTARFAAGHMRDRWFDGSFLLRRVLAARPNGRPEALKAQYDVCWWAKGGGTDEVLAVQPTAVALHQAVTVDLDFDSSYYGLNDDTINVRAAVEAPLAPLEAELVVIAEPRAGGEEFTAPLAPKDKAATAIDAHGFFEYVAPPGGRAKIPSTFRVGVRTKAGGQRMGPETRMCPVPPLPSSIPAVSAYRDNNGLHLSWPKTAANGLPGPVKVRLRFTVLNSDGNLADHPDAVCQAEVASASAVLKDAALAANASNGGALLRVRCELITVDTPHLSGAVWKDELRFNVQPLARADLQFDLKSDQTVFKRSSLVAFAPRFSDFVDVIFVSGDGSSNKIRNARFAWRARLPDGTRRYREVTVGPVLDSHSPAGAFSVFHFDDRFDMICWVGTDGALNIWVRNQRFLETDPKLSPWVSVEPTGKPPFFQPGAANITNGGSLVASGAEMPGSVGSVLWWIDTNGEFAMARQWRWEKYDGETAPPPELYEWPANRPQLTRNTSDGGAAASGLRMQQMQTLFGMPGSLMWIAPSGALKQATAPIGDPAQSALPGPGDTRVHDAVADAGGSSACGLAVYTWRGYDKLSGEERSAVHFAFWASSDGAVWGAYAGVAETATWTKFSVAPAEHAHTATRLHVLPARGKEALALLWFGGAGQLRVATWAADSRRDGNLTAWSYTADVPLSGITSRAGTDYAPELCVHGWMDEDGQPHRAQLFWVGTDDCLKTVTVTL